MLLKMSHCRISTTSNTKKQLLSGINNARLSEPIILIIIILITNNLYITITILIMISIILNNNSYNKYFLLLKSEMFGENCID